MKYYNVQAEKVLKELNVNEKLGLNSSEVKERIEKFGVNEFTKAKEVSLWEEVKESITDKMMIILLVAAFISGLIGEIYDAIGIVCAIAIGIAIKIITEGQSKKAADELSKMTGNIMVKVLRNGEITQISKSELVPGDIAFVETGDMIPADGRLISSIDLKIREDMLTGESDDVSKSSDLIIEMESIESKGKTVVQEPVPAKQKNMLFLGSLVAYGRGTLVVTGTGDSTEMGKIAMSLKESDLQTPLQAKLGGLGETISKVSSVIALIMFIVMFAKLILRKEFNVDLTGVLPFLNSIDPVKNAFIICITLIVAAVPEGLPTMISMTLAITKQKMAKINALVTKNEACETIGSVSVICSDKTGTLTQNRMTVEKIYIDGDYVNDNKADYASYFTENCLINSTADIEINGADVKYLGSATECALILHHKDQDYINVRKTAEVKHQIPFSSKNKKMVTVIAGLDNSQVFLTKGAPEVVLNLCKFENKAGKTIALIPERKEEIQKEIEALQKKSMRLLGFAYQIFKEYDEIALDYDSDLVSGNLVFTGFVAIKDPLRPDVKESIETAGKAGVETKMLTGDNINTAIAIGEELGLLKSGKRAIEASYIDLLSDAELREEIKNIAIVARSKPDTKMRIVEALQANGEVVAVTGDGINDAPALTKADVGIAMGIAGTEVSKKAADIILTDDSFSTIVQGIKWGRGIYENFQRFIQFQITVNLVAFFVAILSVLFDFQMPFTTIQLLWVNIIMDGPPALSLGLEAVRERVLERKPINRNANIITKPMFISMLLNAFYMSGVLIMQMTFNPLGASTEIINAASEMETVLFALFAFGALFNAFNCREFGLNSIIPKFLNNRIALVIISITAVAQVIVTTVFADFFNAVPLSALMWAKIIGLASLVIVVNEVVKFILRMVTKNKTI
ncbi:MAG: calcium-translocating P-type ATPase, PMCA-type [Clostridiaceae bacterium]|nr:calcium-translocating P-type ATPase, PMCA-type [Clostridiaceae bacterium]